MFDELSAHFITKAYSLLLSEQLVHSTFSYLTKRKLESSKSFDMHTMFFHTFLYKKSKHYIDIANRNFLTADEQIVFDLSEKKSKPSYWIKEYEGFAKLRASMGRNPDGAYLNGFKIPDCWLDKIKYDDKVMDIVKKENDTSNHQL